jgi:biopolymer transport protein ExbD
MAGTTNLGGGGPAGEISFNYIPLIDVTFNLIIFFALTSEISGAQNARILVPDPHSPQAVPRSSMSKNNVTIAIISKAAYDKTTDPETASRAYRYEIDGQEFDVTDLDKLVTMIKQRQLAYQKFLGATAGSGEFFVEIRADSRLSFSEVSPVIQAVAGAGIPRMAISAKKAA